MNARPERVSYELLGRERQVSEARTGVRNQDSGHKREFLQDDIFPPTDIRTSHCAAQKEKCPLTGWHAARNTSAQPEYLGRLGHASSLACSNGGNNMLKTAPLGPITSTEQSAAAAVVKFEPSLDCTLLELLNAIADLHSAGVVVRLRAEVRARQGRVRVPFVELRSFVEPR